MGSIYERKGKSGKELWRNFYELERQLFEMFEAPEKSGILILEGMAGHEPCYHEKKQKDGKINLYPPKNIRQIAMVPENILISVNKKLKQMCNAYKAAMTARGQQFKFMPQRFPQIIERVSLIHILENPAFCSVAVKPDENLKLFKRGATQFKGLTDDQVHDYWWRQIEGFKSKGVDAYINSHMQHIVVNSAQLLQLSDTGKLQFRIASGTRYRLSVYDYEDVSEIINYGWVLIKEQQLKDFPIIHIAQRQLPTKMSRRSNPINLPFLPKSHKFWPKY